jgi:hypothetical protein
MRKNLFFVAVILILCGILYVIKYKKTHSSLEGSNFSIEDISDIGSIELSDKGGNKTQIILSGKTWLVDNTYPAEIAKMNTLLETLNKIQVDMPVSQKLRPIAIENLRLHSIEVKIKDKSGDELKTIYVGGTYYNGNYMILSENGIVSPQPYVVKIPGFKGDLKHRFVAISTMWKSTSIFATPVDKIERITVNHFDHPEFSFTLHKDEDLVKIDPIDEKLRINRKLDQNKVVQFLLEFEDKHFETWLELDTVIQQIKIKKPFASIEVEDIFSKKKTIVFYRKPSNPNLNQLDAAGKPLPFDVEKYWCYLPQTKEYVLTQHFVFGPALEVYDYFFEDDKR